VVVATNHVFGEGKLFRFDMSEFQNQEALGLLLGARLAATHCAASKARCSGGNYHSLLRCQDISGRLFPTVSQWFWRLLQQEPKPLKQTGSREEPWHDSGGSMRLSLKPVACLASRLARSASDGVFVWFILGA